MQSSITRIALLQFLVVFYCILAVGIILKVRFGSPAPPIFATHLRDYGFLLLILPATWLVWSSISGNRPRAGTGDLPPILISGLFLIGLLLIIAFLGTMSAFSAGSLLHYTNSR